jgi:hypothetical protein
MTRLPQLEAQLVAAAASRHPRSRRPVLIAAAALAIAASVLVALLLAARPAPERPVTVPETVPAATLVKARALAKAPIPREARLPRDRLPAELTRIKAQTPYPPGTSDHFDWVKNAWKFRTTLALQGSVEYRAYCLWVKYWVTGNDRAGATAVLDQYSEWPTQRQQPVYWQRKIQTAARNGDVTVMRQEAGASCSRVN